MLRSLTCVVFSLCLALTTLDAASAQTKKFTEESLKWPDFRLHAQEGSGPLDLPQPHRDQRASLQEKTTIPPSHTVGKPVGAGNSWLRPDWSPTMEEPVTCTGDPVVQTPRGSQHVCGLGAGPVTRQQAIDAAWHYAPVLWFHPNEEYFIDSAERMLDNAMIYDVNGEFVGNVTEEAMLRLSLDPRAAYYISHKDSPLHEDIKKGADFDGDQSKAPIYFRMFFSAERNTWNYMFTFWFPWNGCSNQHVLLSEKGVESQMEYVACPFGVHEGDWEMVAVEVCADLSNVVRVSYSQHGWTEEIDCNNDIDKAPGTPDNYINSYDHPCRLINGTHPPGFIALNSHATYPIQTWTFPYLQIAVGQLASLKAFSLVDRSKAGTKHFRPRPDNVLPLDTTDSVPNITSVYQQYQDDQPRADWSAGATWAYWDQRWGESYFQDIRELEDPECLVDEQQKLGECPNNLIFDITRLLLGITKNNFVSNVDIRNLLVKEAGEVLSAWGPSGPTHKKWYYEWPVAVPSPRVQKGEPLICPDKSKLQTEVFKVQPIEVSEDGAAIGAVCLVIFVGAGVLLAIVAMLGKKDFWRDHPELRGSTGGAWEGCRDLSRTIPKTSCFAMLVAGIGAFLVWDGLDNSFKLLRRYVDSPSWDIVEGWIGALTPVILTIDLLALVTAFFVTGKTFEYFCMHRQARCHELLVRKGWCGQGAVIGLILFASVVNLVAVVYGTLFYGVSFAFRRACVEIEKHTADLLAGVCVNLEEFGLPNVYCGNDITVFCNDWRAVNSQYVLIGSLFINMGQIFFVAVAGFHFHRFWVFRQHADKNVRQLFHIMNPDTDIHDMGYKDTFEVTQEPSVQQKREAAIRASAAKRLAKEEKGAGTEGTDDPDPLATDKVDEDELMDQWTHSIELEDRTTLHDANGDLEAAAARQQSAAELMGSGPRSDE